jgi:hypothetical protein
MAEASASRMLISLKKPELLAAIAGLDAHLENTAPAAWAQVDPKIGTALSERQRGDLFRRVADKRFEVS